MAYRVYIETLFSGVPYCVMLTLVGYMNMLGYYQLIFYTLLFFPFLLFQPIKYLSLLCYFSLPSLQILFYFSSSLLISSLLLLPSQHDRTMCRLPKIPRYKPPPFPKDISYNFTKILWNKRKHMSVVFMVQGTR